MNDQINPEVEAFLGQPGAFAFLDTLKIYTDKGQTFEQAVESVRRDWLMLLTNVSDGLHRDSSRHVAAAQKLKAHLADQVWDAVNGVTA